MLHPYSTSNLRVQNFDRRRAAVRRPIDGCSNFRRGAPPAWLHRRGALRRRPPRRRHCPRVSICLTHAGECSFLVFFASIIVICVRTEVRGVTVLSRAPSELTSTKTRQKWRVAPRAPQILAHEISLDDLNGPLCLGCIPAEGASDLERRSSGSS